MLTLTKDTVNEVAELATNYRFVDDTKVILNYRLKNGTELDVVLQTSKRNESTFLFAVFRRIGNTWKRLESGFHHDIEHIKTYLINEYLSQSNLEGRKVM